MAFSLEMFKKCEDSAEDCATRGSSPAGESETKETSNSETLDVSLGNLRYLRPVLGGLRATGMITWLEQDILGPTRPRRCNLMLLAGVIRFLHVAVVLTVIVFSVLQYTPHDVGEMTTLAAHLGTNMVSVYLLLALCFRNSVLARLCYRLTTLDSFFSAWQREKPVPEAIRIRRPTLLSTDATLLLMILLYLVSMGAHFSALSRGSFVELLITLPIYCVMVTASASIFLVVMLYRVVIKLLAFEMRRFIIATQTEMAALSHASSRKSGISKYLGVARGRSFSLSNVESQDNTHTASQDEEYGHTYSEEVLILGEAFLHMGQIKDDLLAYLGMPLCLTMFTFSTFVICSIYESFMRGFALSSLFATVLGVVTPMLMVFAICRSPETLRTQSEQCDMTLHTVQLRVPCVPLQTQIGVVREALNRISDFRVGGLFSLGNKVVLSVDELRLYLLRQQCLSTDNQFSAALQAVEAWPGFSMGRFFVLARARMVDMAHFVAMYVVILHQFWVNEEENLPSPATSMPPTTPTIGP